jgi:hypothetical protein
MDADNDRRKSLRLRQRVLVGFGKLKGWRAFDDGAGRKN